MQVAPAIADDTDANRLFVEAATLYHTMGSAQIPDERWNVLSQVIGALETIVLDHRSSSVAVALASGQSIGEINLFELREERSRLENELSKDPDISDIGNTLAVLRADDELSWLLTVLDRYDYLLEYGRGTYNSYCAACHETEAFFAAGAPDLSDDDWLWGGDIESIADTIRHGIRNREDDYQRWSEMPAFGSGFLRNEEIANVVAFVRALSKLNDGPGNAVAGATVFADNCAACHGDDGKGDRTQGAPNLTDGIWLYGSSIAEVEHSVRTGPFGTDRAWGMHPDFDEARIKAVALYVHQMGGGE